MSISSFLLKRYSTKKFDPTRVISAADLQSIKDLLRLSPSSVNAQPWHFLIAGTKQGKQSVAKSTEGPNSFNTEKVLDASHVAVLCRKTGIDAKYLGHLTATEDGDGRYPDPKVREYVDEVRSFYVNFHNTELKDLDQWMAKQVYLAAGMLLMGVAAMGIDAVPLEGFNAAVLDQELKLKDKGLASELIIPLGYRSAEDSNAQLPKSRFREAEVITEI